MKKYIIVYAGMLMLSCHSVQHKPADTTVLTGTAVDFSQIRSGSITDEVSVFATTTYLKRNLVTAPFPAFITNVNIHLGDRVTKGQVLYELESKEHRALGQGTQLPDSSLANFGIVSVKAPASGVITTFDKQQTGDYVMEGAQLCTIAESNDLAFQLNVPYEFSHYLRQGSRCLILLPDNSQKEVIVTAPLTAMNMSAQTQTVLAKSTEPLFLPENLIVKALIQKGISQNRQILPKSCVQSDEMLQQFWIMKLINDSTAVKIPVKPGKSNQQDIEIISPAFSATDRIISSGGYGLGDTALVTIKK